ncbi:hypothetical protein DUI87_03685 [Hirundo rustica rustica]|uniref:Uncharacterized protein n=1 Tax=Hirundo rustica rustica TaxID=333673 RepID=A0A3M0L260_HIRRU|nr:hypothetical protein DUI87_03685 [Hirundo rustica rustica]
MYKSSLMFTSPDPQETSNPCRRENTAEHKQSRRFLEGIDGNFILQVIEEPRRATKLDLILSNKEGLVGSVKPKGRLGCSDRETAEFQTLRETRRAGK